MAASLNDNYDREETSSEQFLPTETLNDDDNATITAENPIISTIVNLTRRRGRNRARGNRRRSRHPANFYRAVWVSRDSRVTLLFWGYADSLAFLLVRNGTCYACVFTRGRNNVSLATVERLSWSLLCLLYYYCVKFEDDDKKTLCHFFNRVPFTINRKKKKRFLVSFDTWLIINVIYVYCLYIITIFVRS